MIVAVRNDRKKKTDTSGGNTTATNNNSVNKSVEPVKALTDKDQQLIDLILDAHRETLPGGPRMCVKVRPLLCGFQYSVVYLG